VVIVTQTTAGLKELVDHATAARRLFAMADLISDLAHHINQPLAAIAAYAEGSAQHLRAGSAETADLLEVSERISAEALRAGEVVRRLCERIRVAGIRNETVDVRVLLADVLRSLDPAARRLDVPVLLDAGGPTLPVVCYVQGLARALGTLLLRCLETAGNHADHERVLRVKITTHDEPDTVEIGMGIGGYKPSAPSGDVVVAESVPLDAACLAAEIVLVRSLIESHGGRLWVVAESRGLCSARLTLPACRR
jgi:signal transduction histidine kinase